MYLVQMHLKALRCSFVVLQILLTFKNAPR